MPALPPAAAVLRFDYHFTVGEDLAAKCRVFSHYTGAAPTVGDLNTLATADRTNFAANAAGLLFTGWSLDTITITDLTSPTSAVGEDTGSTAGTRVGPPNIAATCLLMSREIARRFRGGHSRVYWPFGVEGDLQDVQTWKSSFVAAAHTDVTNWAGATNADVWSGGGVLSAVAVSYYSGFTVHTGVTGRARNVSTVRLASLVDPVLSDIFRVGIAVQRKRLLHLA